MNRQEQEYDQDTYTFNEKLYTYTEYESFSKLLDTSRLTPHARQILKNHYSQCTDNNVVLGNYSPHQALMEVRKLRLTLNVEKMSLKGMDIISRLTPAWDNAAFILEQVYIHRLIRAVYGFERLAQTTKREYSKIEQENRVSNKRKRFGFGGSDD